MDIKSKPKPINSSFSVVFSRYLILGWVLYSSVTASTVFLEICIIPAFWIVKEVCKETSFSSFLRKRFCNRDQIRTALFNVLLINFSWFAVTHALVLQEFIYLQLQQLYLFKTVILHIKLYIVLTNFYLVMV